MSHPVPVTDIHGSGDKSVTAIAKRLSRSKKSLAVFTEVYRGKTTPKTATEIGTKIGETAKRVLELAKPLTQIGAFRQEKKAGHVAYRKIDFVANRRGQILRLATNKKKLKKHAEQDRPQIVVKIPAIANAIRKAVRKGGDSRIDARLITIDSIDSFAKVHKVKVPKKKLAPVLEETFKKGLAKIVTERGTYHDWGGETNDLWTTRIVVEKKRIAASIGLKGRSKKPPLTPGKMGKNGDQIQRLFNTSAQLFLVQFEGQILQSVVQQLHAFAIVKALETGQTVYYGVIDGDDSARLRLAYKKAFQ